MQNLDVPFVANTEDDTHCFQASLKMILKYFHPKQDNSFEELDKVTKKSRYYTWPFAGNIWIAEQGIRIKIISAFDLKRFSEEGGDYLYEYAGAEVAKDQIERSDIEQERLLARQALETLSHENRIPTVEDIKTFLDQGCIVLCNINWYVLSGEEGYEGHAILVKGYDEKGLIIHDPGLPPKENYHVSFSDFEKAWAYPNEGVKDLTAYSD